MSADAFADLFAAVDGTDPTPLEERYVPAREPWLTSWCRLHSLHLAALARIDDAHPIGARESGRLVGAACRLADAKYRIYLGSIGGAQ